MTTDEFVQKMNMADAFRRCGDAGYYTGYMKGLRRHFNGDAHGSTADHVLWLAKINCADESEKEQGQGYRDGLTGKGPKVRE